MGMRDYNGKPNIPACDVTHFFLEIQPLLRENWKIMCYGPLHLFASQTGRECSLLVPNAAPPKLKCV
jgi:hypothetical protein